MNKEFTRIEPWSPKTSVRHTIHLLTWSRETLRICGILLQAFIPQLSQNLLDALRIGSMCRTYRYTKIGRGVVRPGMVKNVVLVPTPVERKQLDVEQDHKYDANVRTSEFFGDRF